MGETSLTMLIGLGMVLGSAHLCVGLAIGWYMGKSRSAPAGPAVNLEPFVTSVERLRLEMAELSRLSKSVPSPDQGLVTLVARVALSLDELHQSLSNPGRPASPPPKTTEPDGQSHCMGAHAVSNSRILQWFAGQRIRSPVTEEGRRYPFAVQQFLAVRKGEELPEASDFAREQCHDLSATEVRYLIEQRPKESEIVIGLGLPHPVKFLLARIEDYRSVYMYGRVGYLVTARFLEALDHPPYVASFGNSIEPKEPALAS